jgi:peptidoglycan/xylan/chitin deacetylase (PgdA/CDA1 family)
VTDAATHTMKVCITIDMDNYREYRSLVDPSGDGAGPSFYLDAVPRFLDLFDRHGARATFFMIGQDGDRTDHRRLVREIAARGHEVANHSFTHPYNFRRLSRAEKEREISRAEATITDIVGVRPVGFRTPSCDVDGETLGLLQERGYLYDSSIFPSPFMWAFMVYGKLFVRHKDYQLGHPLAPLAPRRPYVPSLDRVHRPRQLTGGREPRILEIPFSVAPVLPVPFYSTLLRRFGCKGFSLLLRAYGRRQPVLHILFHLIELADFGDTSLGRAFARTPGLAVPFAERQRFISHAIGALTQSGETVTLRDLAESLLDVRTQASAVPA